MEDESGLDVLDQPNVDDLGLAREKERGWEESE